MVEETQSSYTGGGEVGGGGAAETADAYDEDAGVL